MKQVVSAWFKRYFSDPEAVFLTVALLLIFAIVYMMGAMLMPVLASIIIAYLLEGIVTKLEKQRLPRLLAVILVFSLFVAVLLLLLFGILPLLADQVTQFFSEMPKMLRNSRSVVMEIPKAYPEFVTEERLRAFLAEFEGDMQSKMSQMTQNLLSYSIASIQSVLTIIIYLVLLPILVFFFLKDKTKMVAWFVAMLPKERSLAVIVWREVNMQIGNYIRGKIAEILIVGVVTYIAFAFFDLRYSALLAASVGLSVLIPYIGAVVVTVPVVLVAYAQWGVEGDFYGVIITYLVLQALDGNVLVPVLFSEVVDLHPVAIIAAVLVFGGLWGFWGVFFAIPLATLVNALMKAWPRAPGDEEALDEAEQHTIIRKD